MSYLDDELAILPQWEGRCSWLYLDSDNPPNATTMIGYLVESLAESQKLPWKRPDGSPASSGDIAADWERVTAMRGNMAAPAYKSPNGLTLQDADIDAFTLAKLQVFDADLRADFPGYDSAPDCAKTRLLDMEWGLGDTKLRGSYPHFDAAVDAALAGNKSAWLTAASECARNASNPAFAKRNNWTKQGFEQAASQ